ncbi:MAG: hypothetical protein EAZ44_09595, partial [Cytophagia bacterium]
MLLLLGGCIEGMCPESQTKISHFQLAGQFELNIKFMRENDCCYVVRFNKNGAFNQPLDTIKMFNHIGSSGEILINNDNYTFDYDYLVRTNVGDYKVTDFELETKSCRTAW